MCSRKRNHQSVVQLPKLWTLCRHNVRNLASVLRGKHHPWVTRVADPCYPLEELSFREGVREGEKRSADGRGKVDLLSEPDPGVVLDNTKGLMHASSEVERPPVKEVRAEVVDGRHTVLDRLDQGKHERVKRCDDDDIPLLRWSRTD